MPSPRKKELSKRTTNRLWFVGCSLALTAAFHFCYAEYLADLWYYFGFNPITAEWHIIALTYLIAVAPSLWMPCEFKRPSLVLYWSVYAITYIPSILVLTFAVSDGESPRYALQAALFASMQIIGLCYWLPAIRIRKKHLTVPSFLTIVLLCSASLIGVLVLTYGVSFSLAPLSDPYGARSAASVAGGSLVGYASAWIPPIVIGLLMSLGYVRKNWMLVTAGIAVSIYLYMAVASRGHLTPIVIAAAVFLAALINRNKIGTFMMGGCALLIVLLTLSYSGWNDETLTNTQGLSSVMLAQFIVLFRTFGNTGLLTLKYDDFAATEGYTYWSHVRGIDAFVDYPFNEPLSREVGLHTYGSFDNNAVAHMFAYDGIAAAGIDGVLVVGVICMLVFWFIDSVSARLDKVFTAIFICYYISMLNNTGLFTTLIGHGLVIQILVLYYMPRKLAPEKDGNKLALAQNSVADT